MHTTVLIDIQQVTPKWLTALFQQNGHLREGRVVDLRVTGTTSTNVSQVYFLEVGYQGAPVRVSNHFFVKILKPNLIPAEKEVEFYTLILPEMMRLGDGHHKLFPTCYDAAYAPETNRSHLILEDLSPTHFTHQGQMPPNNRLCEFVIDAYAYLHAFWWEHAWLGQRIGEFLTEEAIDKSLAMAQAKQSDFVQTVGEEVSPEQHHVLKAVTTAWPKRRRQRVVAGTGVTLVHRDPHPGNFLYPYDENGAVKLIDWQSWRVDTGTDDLAYWMACHWPLEEVTILEQELLQRYYQRLVGYGVERYNWQDCWYDYRASIIRCLFFLMVAWSPAQWAGGTWWSRVQRGLSAFERLRCAELLVE